MLELERKSHILGLISISMLLIEVATIGVFGYASHIDHRPLGLGCILVCMVAYIVMVICNVRRRKLDEEQQNLPKMPDPLEEPISSYHGDTLDVLMANLRNEPLEYIAVCDLDGKVLAEGTKLSANTCEVRTEDWDEIKKTHRSVIAVHNHPELLEGPFSRGDLALITIERIRSSIVVTSHFNYVLHRPKGTKIYFDDIYDNTAKLYHSAWSFYKLIETLDLPICLARWIHIGIVHIIARKYGLKFTIEDLRIRYLKAWVKANWRRIAITAGCLLFLVNIGS